MVSVRQRKICEEVVQVVLRLNGMKWVEVGKVGKEQ